MWSLPHVKCVKHGSHVRIFRALLAPHVHARAHAGRSIVCRAPNALPKHLVQSQVAGDA